MDTRVLSSRLRAGERAFEELKLEAANMEQNLASKPHLDLNHAPICFVWC